MSDSILTRPLLVAAVEYDSGDAPMEFFKIRINGDCYQGGFLSGSDLYQEVVKLFGSKITKSCHPVRQAPSEEDVRVFDSSTNCYVTLKELDKIDIIRRFGRLVRLNVTIKRPSEVLAIAGRYFEFDGRLVVAGHHIVIEEESNRIGAGTAINVWDGSVLLARFLEKNSTLVKGLRVLELGAGCGLAGIAASVLGAKDVVVSDLPIEVDRLQRNVAVNQSNYPEGTRVSARACDWYKPPDLPALFPSQADDEPPAVDVILVADCIWVEELVTPLFSTIKKYASMKTRVLFSYQRRGKATDEAFWSALRCSFSGIEVLPSADADTPKVFHILSCHKKTLSGEPS